MSINTLTEQEFNKLRAGFMARVAAPNISAAALKLAYVIAFKRINRETRSVFIGQDTLAKELNTSERTIRNLLPILQSCGLSIERGNGRGMASTYRIEETPKGGSQLPPLDAERRKPASTFETERRKFEAAKGGNLEQEKAEASCRPTLLREPKEENQGKKRASRARAQPPDFASQKGSKQESADEKKNRAATINEGFARFWSVYPRKINEDDARAAFTKAIEAGADIESVVARAAVYAVERAEAIRNGDNPKWTLHPATWLKKRKWRDPLPDGAVYDNDTGALVAVEQPRPRRNNGNGRWNSWDEIGAELLAEMGAL